MKDPCTNVSLKRRHNLFQTVIILAGMLLLFGVLGYMLMGRLGVLWAISLGFFVAAMTPKIPPRIFLQRQGAVRLDSAEAAGLNRILEKLVVRAGLPEVPALYMIKSDILNAFSMGHQKDAAIVVTDALVRGLSWQEVAGILAHEVGHIRNNDLFLHTVADTVTRVTAILSRIGQVLILLYLPLLFLSDVYLSPVVVLLLVLAPAISSLLQLALSRTREFEADQTAAYLTGDADSLASALEKLESGESNVWKKVFLPRRGHLVPSVLRTHPHTAQRLERLHEMAGDFAVREEECPEWAPIFSGFEVLHDHWHWPRSWFANDG